jgi:hypothetical protein
MESKQHTDVAAVHLSKPPRIAIFHPFFSQAEQIVGIIVDQTARANLSITRSDGVCTSN